MPEILHFIGGIPATGKTTMAHYLEHELREMGYEAKRPVCYTTRPMRGVADGRPAEREGIDYMFIDMEDFEANYAPRIADDPPGTWDADCIDGHWYFNRIANTLPSKDHPVSILPIHLGFVPEMRARYEGRPGIKVSEIYIVVPRHDQTEAVWRERLERERPGRCANDELLLQAQTLENKILKGPIFKPTWNLATDAANFLAMSKRSMGL